MYVCTCVVIALNTYAMRYICTLYYYNNYATSLLGIPREIIQENFLVITRQSCQDRGATRKMSIGLHLHRNVRISSSKFGEILHR